MQFLIGVLILIAFLIFCYLFFCFKIRKLSKEYFHTTNIKEILEMAKINEEETPKSLGSLDSLYLERFKKDFPEANLNELKRQAEALIIDSLHAIEEKNIDKLTNKNDKIKSFITAKINDLKDKDIKYKNIKIHNTVLNHYEVQKGVASLHLATAFEYYQEENNHKKKIQNRIKTEFIYIIDSKNIKDNIKALGLNCPNCGAPIRSLEHKSCNYCKSGVVDLIKKTFVINDIKEY